MENRIYNSLQLREVFHIEFLRWFGREVRSEHYAVKGGTNLRLFFKSFRYSEDMDLDVRSVNINVIKDVVSNILQAKSFTNSLKTFGVNSIIPPDMAKAKQTQTTQRFKIHLITEAGEDLFTKVEFSRRGFSGEVLIQPVLDSVLRAYKLAPLLVPHYSARSAVAQKILALATRSSIQARDIFDLHILSSQYGPDGSIEPALDDSSIKKGHDNIFEVGFEQFRDTVISYLSPGDQDTYNSNVVWDDIKLKVSHFIDSLRGNDA